MTGSLMETIRTWRLGDENGDCRTCVKYKRQCDQTLPRCRTCTERGIKCPGFAVKLSWPADILESKPRHRNRRQRGRPPNASSQESSSSTEVIKSRRDEGVNLSAVSTSGLPSQESFYLSHFFQNIARIALAIDHHGNGYRSLMPMALAEPCILNAALAVAASHYSRWQGKSDQISRGYLQAACKALRERFSNPGLTRSPVTLASMLLLVSYEVFSGSSRWKGHVDAIRGWIHSRKDFSDVNSFLKNWVCLIETQSALNLGTSTMPELDSWVNAAISAPRDALDVLFGCSAQLPKLMSAAARLHVASKEATISNEEIRTQAEALQGHIRATQLEDDAHLTIGLSCNDSFQDFSTSVGMDREDLRRRAAATAEIFRHASHIYVYRIAHGPMEPLTPQMQHTLEEALRLLTLVPDALGPGANLGWCLVVLGAELDRVDQREYINSRWAGLHLLGIYNTKSGQKVLDEVWNHRDLVNQGFASPETWQDTMQRIGQSQILV